MNSVIVKICMPTGHKGEQEPKRTLEELVEEWMQHVDSGTNCEDSWRKLRTLFNRLACRKNLSDRHISLLERMEPFMAKYGRDGSDVQLKGTYAYQTKRGGY